MTDEQNFLEFEINSLENDDNSDPSDFDHEERLEFPIGEEQDFISIFYDIKKDKWGYWYIDNEGEEKEKLFNSFDDIKSGVKIYDKNISDEEIKNFENVKCNYMKEVNNP